ncbi:MAG: hypothetical protein IKM00_01665 [Clostridia bacterium]|nr:hypothetical protein [Clostridia bacterium]
MIKLDVYALSLSLLLRKIQLPPRGSLSSFVQLFIFEFSTWIFRQSEPNGASPLGFFNRQPIAPPSKSQKSLRATAFAFFIYYDFC